MLAIAQQSLPPLPYGLNRFPTLKRKSNSETLTNISLYILLSTEGFLAKTRKKKGSEILEKGDLWKAGRAELEVSGQQGPRLIL